MKEISIEAKEKIFSWLIETCPIGIVLQTDSGFSINEAVTEITGYSKKDIEELPNWFRSLFGKHHEEILDRFSLDSNQTNHNLHSVQLITKKGKERWANLQIHQGGMAICLIQDETIRKKNEDLLKREKDKFQLYLDTAASMFVALDKKGTVTLINKKGCEILGYSETEVLGKNWFDHFLPKKEKDDVKEVFHMMLRGEVETVEFFENKILTKKDEEKLIQWHNAIITNDQGQIEEVVSSGVDITQKRNTKLMQFEALHEGQEKERKRLAAELHDGLIQTLSAISFNLRVLEESMSELHSDKRTAYNNALEFLKEAIDDTRNISHDLSPVTLKNFGLAKAIQRLCERIPGEIKINYHCNEEINVLNDPIEIGLFRIVQELLENVTKHSRASSVTVSLYQFNNALQLKVIDDGVGFQGTAEEMQANGIGLRNIATRVKLLNGKLTIDSRHQKGTAVTIEVPLD
ncbi:PAS domain S-box protein [Fulvivirgaceae bacterium BMA10]|uniref:PAS domain S-box protein n=1 Tax=Splendidivirga corallicola TaxID=3051826 RepID=A0ABT8KVF6_9BACT|nr:PAS domain S-box protein [Fulvivirgaceae bacterium BMA10]